MIEIVRDENGNHWQKTVAGLMPLPPWNDGEALSEEDTYAGCVHAEGIFGRNARRNDGR